MKQLLFAHTCTYLMGLVYIYSLHSTVQAIDICISRLAREDELRKYKHGNEN
jgi:hypothetical protein